MIHWRSTRSQTSPGAAQGITFSEAVQAGLAWDGGLFVPERFPRFVAREFSSIARAPTLHRVADALIAPFVRGDRLESALPGICERAFDFPLVWRTCRRGRPSWAVLELFHGPTSAFKDFGARFLAETISLEPSGNRRRTVLVATSGDTGGAVAAAFHRRSGIDVVVLYPEGRISPRQEKQLTAWGDNVRAFAVAGDFDACQRLAKEAFGDLGLRERYGWISANSINAGRLLPQAAYYAQVSVNYLEQTGREPCFVIPSGNLGNALACVWARQMGFPIRRLILAANSNRAVPEYFATGQYRPRETIATLANAMDVGAPSNFERLTSLWPDLGDLKGFTASLSVSDDEIRRAIAAGPTEYGEIWCPHTSTAVVAAERLGVEDAVIVATAHPAKFDTIVEPLIGRAVDIPAPLAKILERPSRFERIEPSLTRLLSRLGG